MLGVVASASLGANKAVVSVAVAGVSEIDTGTDAVIMSASNQPLIDIRLHSCQTRLQVLMKGQITL